MFNKKTIRDVKLDRKMVLVSVDYNVPGDDHGKVMDDYRVTCSIPTIKYLLSKNCKIVLVSHRGRPKNGVDPSLSLKPVAEDLAKKLNHSVEFASDCIGPVAEAAKKKLKNGQILLLENTRFHEGEKANDKQFASELAQGCDLFVQDAFGNAHRKHATTDAITKILPSVSGLLIEKEVKTIIEAVHEPMRPLMTIVGGAKISDKIDILEQFIKTADIVVIGGAMANTFLKAEGLRVGKSVLDNEALDEAKDILALAKKEASKRPFVFYLPQDGVVAKAPEARAKTHVVDWSAHVFAGSKHYPKRPPRERIEVASDEMILDIGPFSSAFIVGAMQMCGSVIWNGTLGMAEVEGVDGPIGPFAHGTETVIESLMGEFGHRPFSLLGGGDTAAYVSERGLTSCFNHVSTGGGASLELMAGHKLPAIEALEDK